MFARSSQLLPLQRACLQLRAICSAAGAAAVPSPPQDKLSPPADQLQRIVSDCFRAAITPAVCGQLQCQGYAVIDGVLRQPLASRLRQEIVSLRDAGHLHINCTHLVQQDGSRQLLEKAGIWEAELMDKAIQAAAPTFAAFARDTTLQVLLSVLLPHLRLVHQAIKLQYNAGGGGCFPLHFDSHTSVDGRRLTAIVYLNPGWAPGDGGELRLYPLPSPPVDIAPLEGRLLLFPSTTMLHRVLPARHERFCFTTWLSEAVRSPLVSAGTQQQLPAAALQDVCDAGAAWRLMRNQRLLGHVCRLLYAEEWAESVVQSHPAGNSRDAQVALFWREAGILREKIAPLLPYIDKIQQQDAAMAAVMQQQPIKWV